MINGAHAILFSTAAEEDRAFLRDVLGFPSVDAGGGWLIFGLPPAEVAVHPAETNGHELYLMTDDITGLVADLVGRGVACTRPEDQGWGILSRVSLPSGGSIGIYEPRHERPPTL